MKFVKYFGICIVYVYICIYEELLWHQHEIFKGVSVLVR